MTTEPNTARRLLCVAVILPALLGVAALVAQLVLLPTLPTPVAVHWGWGGGPDGFAPPVLVVVLTALGTLLLPGLLAATTLPAVRRGERGIAFRLLGAAALALAALFAALGVGTLAIQQGLGDAAEGPSALPVLIAAFLAGAVAGLVGWAVLPKEDAVARRLDDVTAVTIRPGERVVWMRTTSLAPGAVVALTLTLIVLVLATIAMWMLGDLAAALIVTLVTAITLAALAATAAFHVRVDAEGLHVTSVLGVPRFRVPLAEIERVDHVHVQPMGELGGYGVRSAPGRFGVVLRAGDALDVTRRNGKRFTVSVPDAATAAGVLRAYTEEASV